MSHQERPEVLRMATNRPTPKDQEARFLLDELFFSTTDAKGVITFGNDLFVRVSGYSPAGLLGKPHNLIRHPDMPRAVFRLFWEYLQAGRSVVAYVKNLAADGSYYWVCAMVAPIADGYLSIRLKPSAPFFAAIRTLYGELLSIESAAEDRQSGMEQAGAELGKAVRRLGYDNYGQLMEEILISEVQSRKQLMGAPSGTAQDALAGSGDLAELSAHCGSLTRHVDDLFSRLGAFMELQKALADKTAFIRRLGRGLQYLSLNAQVQSAGLLEDGVTLQVIAGQMSDSARSVCGAADKVCEDMAGAMGALRSAAAQIAMSDLSVETMRHFLSELASAVNQTGTRQRIAQLAEVVEANLSATCAQMTGAADRVMQLDQRLDQFLRGIRTLQILRVTGKVEAVRCREADGVSRIFNDVHSTTDQARQKLSLLADLVGLAQIQAPDRALLDPHIAPLRSGMALDAAEALAA